MLQVCEDVLLAVRSTTSMLLLGSAKGAAHTSKRSGKYFAPHSVLRDFLQSAKGAARTSKRSGKYFAPHSVLRDFLQSAKGAARTSKRSRKHFAPHSVLRDSPKAPIQTKGLLRGLSIDMSNNVPVIVIVGGGFGGLAAAKALKHTPAEVILIDRTNHHLFQPLLYQVATSVLSPGQIGSPLRVVLGKQANTAVLMGEVTGVIPADRLVTVTDADRENVPL